MIYHGDCIEVMKTLPENSVDTCITDPPYGLGFMGKQWDTFDKSQFGVAGNEGENDLKVKKNFNVLPRYRKDGLQEFTFDWASEVYRVLKPGAILLAFGGTRTYHRIACAIEDAGFEIRDTIAWVYGSGFPKSYDISKGIDKQAGAEREVVGRSPHYCEGRGQYTKGDWGMNSKGGDKDTDWLTAPSTPEAQLWHGWGTALKPAFEPIVVAMKPIDGTFVNNALTWGVAGLNIDGGRVGIPEGDDSGWSGSFAVPPAGSATNAFGVHKFAQVNRVKPTGRFPANFIHDGSDEVVGLFPQTGNNWRADKRAIDGSSIFNAGKVLNNIHGISDSGSAARFFYCAKASRSERNAGLEGMPKQPAHPSGNQWATTSMWNGENGDEAWRKKNPNKLQANHHPTVKPLALMRYLCKLTKTPTGGIVLDPFMGSGTTGIACVLEGREFIGIEREAEYIEIAEKRIEHAQGSIPVELPLFAEAK